MYNIFKGMLITTLLCCSAINTNANNTSEALNIEITSNLLQNSDLITEDNLINENNISIESKDKEVVKILALDGGGTRAYLQTKFLEKFCEDANKYTAERTSKKAVQAQQRAEEYMDVSDEDLPF